MALKLMTAEKASTLLQEMSMLNGANHVLPAKIHRYFQQNQQKLWEVTKPFRDKIDALKATFTIEMVDDGKGGKKESFKSLEDEKSFNDKAKDILSGEVRVPLMKLTFEDLDRLAIPARFTFNNFYAYMVDGAPVATLEEEDEEVPEMKIIAKA